MVRKIGGLSLFLVGCLVISKILASWVTTDSGWADVFEVLVPVVLVLPLLYLYLQREQSHDKEREELHLFKESYLETVLKSMGENVSLYDPDGNLVYTNTATAFEGKHLKLPVPVEQWFGRHWTVFHADGQTPMRWQEAPIHRALQGELVINEELCIERPTGEKRFLLFSGKRMVNSAGDVLGTVFISHDITNRKQVEQQLSESEQRYRSLIDNSPDGIAAFDSYGRFVSVNPAFEQLTGYTEEELIGQLPLGLVIIDPVSQTMAREGYEKVKQGQSHQYEFRIRHRDGHDVYIHETDVPITVDGEVIGVFGICKDITERKLAEEELRTTKEYLESFLKNTADYIAITDLRGNVSWVNDAFVHVFGYKQAEVVDKPLPISPERFHDPMCDDPQTMIDGSKVAAYENIGVRKDGTEIDISLTVSPIHDRDGNIISLACVGRDITERKRAELALRKAQQELRDAVRQQQGIIFKFNKVDDRYIHTLCDGDLLYRIGMSPESMIGQEVHQIFEPSLAKYLLEFYERAWKGEEVSYEVQLTEQITSLVRLRPIFQNGAVTEVIGSCIDISELKHTQELLRKSEKLSIVGELAAGVAHEIRNPLTPLRGFVQLLQRKYEDDQKYFEIMLSELDRINLIVSEFVVLAKPQSSSFQQKDLRAVLDNIVAIFDTQAIMYNIQIEKKFADDLWEINCEENQLKQVFINILKNSIDAMPNGGLISVELENQEDDHVLVRFTDTGVGIPEDRISSLGEPFYTTKDKGTGLGLMVSYKIIQNHQGKITIHSELNRGTTVEILLPVSQLHMAVQAANV